MNEEEAAGDFEDESGNETSDSRRTVVVGPKGSSTGATPKLLPHSSSSVDQPSSVKDPEALRDDRKRRQQPIVLDYQTRSTAKQPTFAFAN